MAELIFGKTTSDAIPKDFELKGLIDKIAYFMQRIVEMFEALKEGLTQTFANYVPVKWDED
jgi:hypothetical protein